MIWPPGPFVTSELAPPTVIRSLPSHIQRPSMLPKKPCCSGTCACAGVAIAAIHPASATSLAVRPTTHSRYLRCPRERGGSGYVSSQVKQNVFAGRAALAATAYAVIRFNKSPSETRSLDQPEVRVPVVHVRGNSAIRRPLIILAVCAVAAV